MMYSVPCTMYHTVRTQHTNTIQEQNNLLVVLQKRLIDHRD